MDARRWMLSVGLVSLLAVSAGCMADQVVYVDEQGNELAVDENGAPILPSRNPVILDEPTQPVALDIMDTREVPASSPPAPPSKSPAPSADPDWKLPPTYETPPAGGPTLPPVPPKKQPAAKKIDSSSSLDKPPAG